MTVLLGTFVDGIMQSGQQVKNIFEIIIIIFKI
jgi:hypothetical protein